jgi:hypothetical protein
MIVNCNKALGPIQNMDCRVYDVATGEEIASVFYADDVTGEVRRFIDFAPKGSIAPEYRVDPADRTRILQEILHRRIAIVRPGERLPPLL